MASKLESAIQRDVVDFLEEREWLVEVTTCNAYQKGLPDLYCFHLSFGHRWIDVKRPKGSTLTKSQCQKWTKWRQAGLGVWIMIAPTEHEYLKLFNPPNWRKWWKPRYEKYLLTPADVIRTLNESE